MLKHLVKSSRCPGEWSGLRESNPRAQLGRLEPEPLGQARIWMPRVAAEPRERVPNAFLSWSRYSRGILNYKANC